MYNQKIKTEKAHLGRIKLIGSENQRWGQKQRRTPQFPDGSVVLRFCKIPRILFPFFLFLSQPVQIFFTIFKTWGIECPIIHSPQVLGPMVISEN